MINRRCGNEQKDQIAQIIACYQITIAHYFTGIRSQMKLIHNIPCYRFGTYCPLNGCPHWYELNRGVETYYNALKLPTKGKNANLCGCLGQANTYSIKTLSQGFSIWEAVNDSTIYSTLTKYINYSIRQLYYLKHSMLIIPLKCDTLMALRKQKSVI